MTRMGRWQSLAALCVNAASIRSQIAEFAAERELVGGDHRLDAAEARVDCGEPGFDVHHARAGRRLASFVLGVVDEVDDPPDRRLVVAASDEVAACKRAVILREW